MFFGKFATANAQLTPQRCRMINALQRLSELVRIVLFDDDLLDYPRYFGVMGGNDRLAVRHRLDQHGREAFAAPFRIAPARQAEHIARVINGRQCGAAQLAEERHLRFNADPACQLLHVHGLPPVLPADDPHFHIVVAKFLNRFEQHLVPFRLAEKRHDQNHELVRRLVVLQVDRQPHHVHPPPVDPIPLGQLLPVVLRDRYDLVTRRQCSLEQLHVRVEVHLRRMDRHRQRLPQQPLGKVTDE